MKENPTKKLQSTKLLCVQYNILFTLSFETVQTSQFVEVEDHVLRDSETQPAISRSPIRAFASTRKIFSWLVVNSSTL